MKALLLAVVLVLAPLCLHADELPKGWDPRPNVTIGSGIGWGEFKTLDVSVSPKTIWDQGERDVRSYFGRLEVPAGQRVTFLAAYTYMEEDENPEESPFAYTSSLNVAEFAVRIYLFD
jgi:hypothetical protein